MRSSSKSIPQSLSQSQVSRKSFRVVVKNRITHQIVDPQRQKSKSQLQLMKTTLKNQSFQQTKNHLKKYIRNMKASSKVSNHNTIIHTNRSSCPHAQTQSNAKSSRSNLSSQKHLNNSLRTSSIQQNKLHKQTENKYQQLSKKYLNSNITQITKNDHKVKCLTQTHQEQSINKLPTLNSSLQNYSEIYQNYEQKNKNIPQTSSRQRLCDLQNKIQSLLIQKLKMISNTDSFSNQNQNRNSYKLLQKQMDRILQQIRKIKQNQQNLSNKDIQDFQVKDAQINKNIQIFEKKVKILQRLIAEKLFESDNLKNQYLWKIKQHKKHISQMSYSVNSKSSSFYRQANKLSLASFKPNKYEKSKVCANQMTTNKADYKIPMKSYYITPKKDHFYNSNKLSQPLPRSTYNRQYLIYGALPKDIIRVKSINKDHKLFTTLSPNQQKHILQGSTYRQDFISKIQKDPINFKQLDAYKDKFKNLQINYGKQRNNQKIVNSHSVIQYYDDNRSLYQSQSSKPQKKNNNQMRKSNNENPQKTLPILGTSDSKKANLRMKLQQLSRPIESFNLTQKRDSMIEQEQINKNNLFNQRIKSQIKHKNLYDQKYRFKNELIKQKILKIKGSSRKQRLKYLQTIQN